MAKDNKDKEQAKAAQAAEAGKANADVATPEAPVSEAQNYGKSPEELEAVKQQKTAEAEKPRAKKKEPEADAPKAPKNSRKATPLEIEAVKILDEHPGQDRVYMTADGFGYFNEHDARNHARDIKDDNIITIAR